MIARSPEAFAAAARGYRFDLPAPACAALRGARVVVLGEPHGVAETPAVLYALVVELGARAVAFEWSHDELGRAVRGGRIDLERLWSLPADAEALSGDGRLTAGHVALLERLHAERRVDQVVCFDRLDSGPADDWRVRDREMAERLVAEWRGAAPLLVVAGAFHAGLEKGTMAWHLRRRLDGVRTAMLAYERGACWSRGRRHDVSGPMPPAPVVLRVPEATPAVVPGR